MCRRSAVPVLLAAGFGPALLVLPACQEAARSAEADATSADPGAALAYGPATALGNGEIRTYVLDVERGGEPAPGLEGAVLVRRLSISPRYAGKAFVRTADSVTFESDPGAAPVQVTSTVTPASGAQS